MRILIDATPLLLRSAGVKNYIYHWVRALNEAGGAEIRLFPYLKGFGALDHEASVISGAATWPRLGLLYFVNVPGNPAIDWIASGADVVHLTNQVRNPPRSARLTATIHDLTCWLMPEVHTDANVRADKSFARKTLSRAAGLIAVSESTRSDAVRLLDLDPDRIEVIYPGVAEPYFEAGAVEADRIRELYNLKRPYILFIGAIEPRKNIDGLLDAYFGLTPSVRRDVELVIAGPPGWSAGPTLDRLASGIPGIRYLGYVPEGRLPGLTAGAAVFAYPSFYEGFGFPVAQALACGTPVVVSNLSSLPEVAGDAGFLVEPRSVRAMTAALDRLLSDSALHALLRQKSRQQASRFRWPACAAQSVAFFRKVAGRIE
ncbi:MAG: glycosyltransferase family 4 protein [Bryobacteraceae bacterium]|nr:glycosyltransferase family 4 protein [Bryobacteraceae bacterium]